MSQVTREHLAGLELAQKQLSITNPFVAEQLDHLLALAMDASRAAPPASQVQGERERERERAVHAAFNAWSWNKKGEAVGRMDGQTAAIEGFHAGAEWQLRAALSAPPPSEAPAGVYAIHYLDNWDGQGDRYFAIAHKYPDGRWLFEESGKELLQYEGDKILRVWPLSAASPAPGGPEVREAVVAAIAEALGDALDCTRVWSAWGAGTMSEEDFRQVADDPERVAEIADAAIAAIGNAALTPSDGAQEAWKKAALVEWCSLDFTKMTRREMAVYIGQQNFNISHLQRIVDAKTTKHQPAIVLPERCTEYVGDRDNLQWARGANFMLGEFLRLNPHLQPAPTAQGDEA